MRSGLRRRRSWRTSGSALQLGRALPALIAWVAVGCEVLVDGQLGPVRCRDEGTVGPPACPPGQVCKGGLCAPTVLGALCGVDADCASGEFCLDVAPLGGVGPRRCSRTCCGSIDCDPDPQAVCWVPPVGGGAFCRPAAEIGRTPGGTRGPLLPCAGGGDCRSGRCVEHICADTCCSDTHCAGNGGVCRLDGPPFGDAAGFWCGRPQGPSYGLYAPCAKDADCASGLCLNLGNKQLQCSTPCCSSGDCMDLDGVPVRCVILEGVHHGVRACQAQGGAGSGTVGAPCTLPSDCRGGMCLNQGGRDQCSDVCCSDLGCGDPSTSVCRLATVDGVWALQCEPK
jgi:hypothetical protein